MLPYKELSISCRTNPDIPPPYSHIYNITVDENPAYLTLSFKLRYTDRDELSEEEILEEGFGPDDDFTWSGKLNKIWKQQLDALLAATRFYNNPSSGGDFTVEVVSKTGTADKREYVSKKEAAGWVYFIQELKQAILESEQLEAPLTIEYLKIGSGPAVHLVLNGSFTSRTFTVRVNDRPVEQLEWPVLQKTINLIFNETEIDYDEAASDTPSAEGYYLMLPGAGWLELGEDIRARFDDIPVLENIVTTMNGFIDGRQA
ncbi:MAG: hypothetical protein ABS46_08285 [Cytophagaceae bacterium SCN 52-12]|nr:MAG: hypothetical protein ABS46_08285 [Cytophagaceae bacterium SCN 52-12]